MCHKLVEPVHEEGASYSIKLVMNVYHARIMYPVEHNEVAGIYCNMV